MKKGFDLLVLDENYQIVSLLNYTLLQWTRKYYESGLFSVEIPADTYSKEFKYIYTNERAEMGVIEQVNFSIKGGTQSVTLSGYFLENECNRRIAYSKGTVSNILNQPTWSIQSSNAEDVALAFFDAFKDVSFDKDGVRYNCSLNIATGTSQGRGKPSEHTRGNEKLGNKLHSILKPSMMSYRIRYDFDTSEKVFEVWSGVDRRADNEEGNNPIVFSTKYGNITKADLLVDKASYKNAYVNTAKDDENTFTIMGSEAEENEEINFVSIDSAESTTDYATQAEYINALHAEGHEELLTHPRVFNLEFDTIEGSYEYLEDFDLGDRCTIEIAELELSTDAVLTGIYEVVKKGIWSMSLEFTTN